MIIGSKAMIVEDQLKNRADMGSKYFEAHTHNDFLDNADIGVCRSLIDKHKMICYSIHAPFRDDIANTGIGVIDRKRANNLVRYIEQCMEMAEELCDVEEPTVVVHCDGYIRMEEAYNLQKVHELAEKSRENAFNQIDDIMDFREKKKYRTKILIENVLKFNFKSNRDMLIRVFGSDFDADKIVEIANREGLGTVLDTCHALGDINLYKTTNPFKDLSINDYIASFSSTVGLVHLVNARTFGDRREEHGILFKTEKEQAILDKIFDTMIKYNYNVPITLELSDMSEYKIMIEQVKEILDKRNVKYVY